jgi:hypothetical protein
MDIPSIDRPEWLKLLKGEIEHTFKSYVFQLTLHQSRQDLKLGNITETQAVQKLYALCDKYKLATGKDIDVIFNQPTT